jgi:hypothetical protein
METFTDVAIILAANLRRINDFDIFWSLDPRRECRVSQTTARYRYALPIGQREI